MSTSTTSIDSKAILRDPSELEGALLVEATAVADGDNANRSNYAQPAIRDAVAVAPYDPTTTTTHTGNEHYLAWVATQRGRAAASAEIEALRAYNARPDPSSECSSVTTAAVREIPEKEDEDDASGVQAKQIARNVGLFGSGGYEVQEYSTGDYDITEYQTKEYKSVYD